MGIARASRRRHDRAPQDRARYPQNTIAIMWNF